MSGRSVGYIIIIIILRFIADTFKYKNIDHRVKETCATMSTKVACETDHISLLVIQQCQMKQNFVFYVFHCNLKE